MTILGIVAFVAAILFVVPSFLRENLSARIAMLVLILALLVDGVVGLNGVLDQPDQNDPAVAEKK